jgi:3-deoxy-manno-octulosonate cytidylyltransferase (CMP-KDO synthetase)
MPLHVIIPARWGSSRLPGKPLVDIAGKPMIQHVAERASQADNVASVTVATDDQRIAEAVRGFGFDALMTPAARTGSDRVAAAADMMSIDDQDLVVNVQGDQPLLPPELINQTAAPLFNEQALGMTTPVKATASARELSDPTDVKVVMDRVGNALYFSRQLIPLPRDGGDATFYKHLGVYVFRKSFLAVFAQLPTGRLESIEKLEQLRVLENGYPLRCVITEYDSPEVDRLEHAREVGRRLI